jgi:hypothetical protein
MARPVEQGYTKAQFALGYCYAFGKGVEKDEVEAYALYSLAGVSYDNARWVRKGNVTKSNSRSTASHKRASSGVREV